MSNEEKSIHVIKFLDKKAGGKSWSEKFLSHGEHKGYRKLLVSSGSTSGVNKIPMQEGYENSLKGGADLNNRFAGKLNNFADEFLICPLIQIPQWER